MNKLMKQFWIYGALPLTLLYLLNLALVKLYILNLPNDCIFNSGGCPKGHEVPDNVFLPLALIVTAVLLLLTAFNAFRVFKLSKTEPYAQRKATVRTAVLIIPIIAIGLFIPLLKLVNV
jgi:hypothetical protein